MQMFDRMHGAVAWLWPLDRQPHCYCKRGVAIGANYFFDASVGVVTDLASVSSSIPALAQLDGTLCFLCCQVRTDLLQILNLISSTKLLDTPKFLLNLS